MKRIHFTDVDLRNVRVGATYGPLAETALSLERLMRTDWSGAPAAPTERIGFDGWRERVAGHVAPVERALAQLLPRAVDIITLTGRLPSIDEGLEAVASAPAELLRAELAYSATAPFRPPAWAAVLAEPATGARKQLAGALRAYHDKAVAPHWPEVARLLEAERDRAVRLLGEHGIDHFLASCHPTISWDPPVLTIDPCLPIGDQETHLDGRGLVLVPSLFCPPGYPMCAAPDEPDASPVIHYPISLDVATLRRLWEPPTAAGARAPSSLAALLGRTRAAVLYAVATGPLHHQRTGSPGRRVGAVSQRARRCPAQRRPRRHPPRRQGRAPQRHTARRPLLDAAPPP